MPGEGRHFATVLFLDIVGSTQIADELGDADWHRLLARFRSTVRTELKRHGGHEVDTAGDGFFATFGDPLDAIRAADAIARAVQGLGLDVRAGIHAGEVEAGDKHVTGMTVHVGARTMVFAGPARTAVTSTVRDMEVGGPVRFEDAGEHELKGVPGTWHLSLVGRLDEREPAGSLDLSTAPELRGAVLGDHPKRRVALVAAAAVAAVALVVSLLVWARPRHPSSPPVAVRPVMLKVDVAAKTVQASVDIPTVVGGPYWAPGVLGQQIVRVMPDTVEFRDPSTGELKDHFRIRSWQWVSVGAGSVWLDSMSGASEPYLLRLDPRTGRGVDRSTRAGGVWNLWWGTGGGWSFGMSDVGASRLVNIDPVTLGVTTWPMPDGDWQLAVPLRHGVWAFGPGAGSQGRLIWVDVQTGMTHPLHMTAGQTLIVVGPDAYNPSGAYIFDSSTSTLTPLGEGRPGTSEALGVVEAPKELLEPRQPILFGSEMGGTLWIAAYGLRGAGERSGAVDSVVVGIPENGEGTPAEVVRLPRGFEAQHTLAVGGVLWVGSCYCGIAY